MQISFGLICGLALGLEYVEVDEEGGIDYPCIILDLLILRVIVEFAAS